MPAYAVQNPATQQRQIHLPEPTGPYGVGTRLFHWVDPPRPEIGTPEESDVRELMVAVSYPADVLAGSTPAPYEPRAEVYRSHDLFDDEDLEVVAATSRHAVSDAPVAAGPKRYPILVLSTGNGEMAFMYTALAEELASHGFVIAVLSHPGVASVAYPDGRVLRRYPRLYNPKPEGWDSLLSDDSPLALRRAIYDGYYREARAYLAADVSFVIDQLAALDAGASEALFQGRIDLERVGTIGHSYGGNVAVEACARDPRVKACTVLDGGAFGPIRDEGLERPLMLFRPAFLSDGTPLRVAQAQLIGSVKADAYEVNILGAEHRSFMDSRFLFPENRLTPTGPGRVLAITSAYMRAFFDRHMYGMESVLLDGPSLAFPDVYLRILRFYYPNHDYKEMEAGSRRAVREP
jgi:predicted dienelactone hydrolase